MKRKNIMTRILLSLFTLALLTGMAAAQATTTKPAKSSKTAKADSARHTRICPNARGITAPTRSTSPAP